MRYPGFLKDGGRIGFIAPSFSCVTEPYSSRFAEAERRFAAMGYDCIKGPNCDACDGIGKSSTPENCGREINTFFTSDCCDVIISCGGGETMCEDLSFVDFDALAAAKPKWFMGYSDNTNLVFTLPTLCDTAAIYGPNAPSFGMRPWHPAVSDALELLKGTRLTAASYDGWERSEDAADISPYAPYNITEPFEPVFAGSAAAARSASFQGRLIGGCLDCLSVLCGTRFDKAADFAARYAEDGMIWVFEACDLNPMGIRRALWQLENAGWFKNVKGFLIGRPFCLDEDIMGMNRFNAVTGILDKYGVPILMDLDIGHLPPSMPLIMGSLAAVSAENGKVRIDMALR